MYGPNQNPGIDSSEAIAPAPPGSGWPATPGLERPRRRPRWVAVVAVVVLVALVAATGAAVVAAARDDVAWDPRVVDLVGFVERERGLEFRHAVPVEFLAAADFEREVTADEGDLTAEDRADIEDDIGMLRALGLVDPGIDLVETLNEFNAASILAYYDYEAEQIRVRGTELDPALEVTLVHELTHALQDQHFDLESIQRDAEEVGTAAPDALIEGDATAMEDAYYYSELDADERDQYDEAQDYDGYDDSVEDVPGIFQVLSGAPYALGPALADALRADGGNDAVDHAFLEPPVAEEHFFAPPTFVERDDPEPVDVPEVPEGTEQFDEAEFGSVGWFAMLSERIDPHDALRAVDGWGGDRFVAYRDDDRVCVRVAYVGETARDTDEMAAALGEWVVAMPGDSAKVAAEGETLQLESCDPGESHDAVTGRNVDAFMLPVVRSSILRGGLSEGEPLDSAWCFADTVVQEATLEEVADPEGTAFDSEEWERRFAEIYGECA